MLPASGTSTLQSCGFEFGGVIILAGGGGGFFPWTGGVFPFGEALGSAFAAALAGGAELEMMIDYEQISIKSIIKDCC